MSGELERLESAAHDFELSADLDFVDPKRLAVVIDRLQGALCKVVDGARQRGDHLMAGQSACTWVANTCAMSKNAAGDRLCVGAQLKTMPRVAQALSSGEIGYQAADRRTPRQRRADALTELTFHALEAGTIPRRNRVRPHITVHTTVEGLKGELGAAASELQPGMPISSKTVQRLACDGMLSRVLKADSQVVDVGRATPNVSPAQWRALKARHRTCGFPGCDRPVSWTSPHHIEFRARGGLRTLRNLLPLFYHHHRTGPVGEMNVVHARVGLEFIPPDPAVPPLFRGPGVLSAASTP